MSLQALDDRVRDAGLLALGVLAGGAAALVTGDVVPPLLFVGAAATATAWLAR